MNEPIKGATITISLAEHAELVEASEFLDCLRACGVDNWPGYDEARQMMRGDEV
jgi:hypothetical protein